MKVIYRADDGAEFDTKYGAEAHETKLRNPMAVLAINDHGKLDELDVKKVEVGRFAACTTIKFDDGSMIELTNDRVRVYNGDATQCLIQFNRIRTEDIGD